MSSLILIVEDEQDLLSTLEYNLQHEGYRTRCASTGKQALALAHERPVPDLVLLDLMLPDLSGTEVCRALRADERTRHVPVLMLTAKGAEDDVLRGFAAGADDYVTKPFSVRELLARVQALLRRSGRDARSSFHAGPFLVDPERSHAQLHARPDSATIALTAREVRILQLLAGDPGRIVSRRMLLRDAWGMNNADAVETRTVDMHIAKLRKKLGKRGGDLVETVRGQGYRLCPTAR